MVLLDGSVVHGVRYIEEDRCKSTYETLNSQLNVYGKITPPKPINVFCIADGASSFRNCSWVVTQNVLVSLCASFFRLSTISWLSVPTDTY